MQENEKNNEGIKHWQQYNIAHIIADPRIKQIVSNNKENSENHLKKRNNWAAYKNKIIKQ